MLAPLAATRDSGVELLTLLLTELLHLMLCRGIALCHLGERFTKAAIALVRVVAEEASDALQEGISGALRFDAFGFQQASEKGVLLLETENLGVGRVVCECLRFLEGLAFCRDKLNGFLFDGLRERTELLEGLLDLLHTIS